MVEEPWDFGIHFLAGSQTFCEALGMWFDLCVIQLFTTFWFKQQIQFSSLALVRYHKSSRKGTSLSGHWGADLLCYYDVLLQYVNETFLRGRSVWIWRLSQRNDLQFAETTPHWGIICCKTTAKQDVGSSKWWMLVRIPDTLSLHKDNSESCSFVTNQGLEWVWKRSCPN